MLICVIGGKLSEGINFSDNLARTVFVFGLPFPSTQSQALKEKMAFYDQLSKKSSSSFDGKQFYENLTMRVLNQAVGRALRHAQDYAVIAIVDSRIQVRDDLRAKLPGWIRQRVCVAKTATDLQNELTQFYAQFSS